MTDRQSFLTGTQFTVYVDSAAEQYAWLLASFGDPATWRVESQSYRLGDGGEELETAELTVDGGGRVNVVFAPAREEKNPFGDASIEVDDDRTGLMDDLMEKATVYATNNPPHHPGSVARFPVPSASYADAVAIPLPVLAVEGGVRGLYAPPRVVAISWTTQELIGVGEYPDFDPEHWPPPRLGDWPPQSASSLHRMQLQGMIERFSACWSRVLDTWFAKEPMVSAVLREDVRESLMYRDMLDLPAMIERYDRLNPVFAQWLQKIRTESAA